MTRLVRRYEKNQKMYDVQGCGYIRMSELRDVIKKEDLQILDTPSQKDSTLEVLLKAVFNHERDLPKEERVNIFYLHEAIRHGGLINYINFLEKRGKSSCKEPKQNR